MPGRLFRYYQRSRLVNINTNVIVAGMLALIPTAGMVRLSKVFITTDQKWVYTGISVGADIIADVAIYYALHWVANHWRPLRGRSHHERRKLEAKPPPFLKDASLVQFERALLSPLYYITAALLMQFVQHQGVKAYWAVFIAFPTGLMLTRVIHTLWGLRSGTFLDHEAQEERRNRRKGQTRSLDSNAGDGSQPRESERGEVARPSADSADDAVDQEPDRERVSTS